MINEWYIAIAVGIVIAASSLRLVRPHERLAIDTLGRLRRIAGSKRRLTVPFIIPFIERAVRVNLAVTLPGWRGMSGADIAAQVREHLAG